MSLMREGFSTRIFGVLFLVLALVTVAEMAQAAGDPLQLQLTQSIVVAANQENSAVIEYRLSAADLGEAALRDIIIRSHVPACTDGVEASPVSTLLKFSVDGGKTFRMPPTRYVVTDEAGQVAKQPLPLNRAGEPPSAVIEYELADANAGDKAVGDIIIWLLVHACTRDVEGFEVLDHSDELLQLSIDGGQTFRVPMNRDLVIDGASQVMERFLPFDGEGALPGTVIEYELTAVNVSDIPLGDIILRLGIPAGTHYIEGSEQMERSTMLLQFSIDGGQSYRTAPIRYLVQQEDGSQRQVIASADMYSDLRLVFLRPLVPGEEVNFAYRVMVE